MKAELITTDSALAALRPEWEVLWSKAARHPGVTTPFQSPAWLLPWWDAFGTGQPRVAALHGASGLVGLLPLYMLEEGGGRKLLPMGVGITDYLDALIDPAAPAGAASILLETALGSAARDGVASCDLPDLPQGAALHNAAAPPGWRAEAWTGEPCPVLTLPASPEALRGPVPPNTLRKLRMSRHRAERAGGWSAATAGSDEVMPAWDALVAMHQARWTRRGEGGVLADPRVLAFHRAALPQLQQAGALRLLTLRIAGEVAAVYYALAAGPDRLLFYISGFDEARAFESPGTILLGHGIEAAIAEGRREIHFLRGGEAYKYAWGGVDRMNTGRRLLPP
ncbi:GNAT family N-acetyltransferase [Roseomonas sp. SSH11]|uniref:GNAT family N-acetyltransferase n=1 Tax=Pararoseomonas baculiformis TaxID=2820812 RepID=A0ABS4A9D5_9PROT|nr:GNAT family N-acetyltransferase [Pararoseomonas baculiformis]MBP0443617.1 GNAT family N-acetyltransferase [Pararoseomonas baculiformis]